MEPIIFKMRLQLEDFLRVSTHLTWRLVFQPWRVAIYGIALVFVVAQALYSGNAVPAVAVVSGLAVMLVYIRIRVPISLRKKYEGNFRSQEELEFRLDEQTCRITGQTFHLDLPWEKVIKTEHWQDYYLLFTTKYQAHAILKAALGPGREQAVVALLDRVKPGWRK